MTFNNWWQLNHERAKAYNFMKDDIEQPMRKRFRLSIKVLHQELSKSFLIYDTFNVQHNGFIRTMVFKALYGPTKVQVHFSIDWGSEATAKVYIAGKEIVHLSAIQGVFRFKKYQFNNLI